MGAVASLFMSGAETGGAIAEYSGLRTMGEAQETLFEGNAKLAELNADDATRRGNEQANALRRQGRKIRGEQRAASAAQGIDPDSGTAGDIQDESARNVELDVITIKGNAWREAWGHKVQAEDLRYQGKMARIGAYAKAGSTLLTGGLKGAGYAMKGFVRKGGDKYDPVEATRYGGDPLSSQSRTRKGYMPE